MYIKINASMPILETNKLRKMLKYELETQKKLKAITEISSSKQQQVYNSSLTLPKEVFKKTAIADNSKM